MASYTYDGSGHLIEVEEIGYIPSERIRKRITVEWLPGYLEMYERHDRDDDGTVEMTIHKVWDAHGNLLLDEEDYDGDELWDHWYRAEWEGDLLLAVEHDDDLDGVVDYREEFTYNSRGLLIRQEIDTDSPPDGVPETVIAISRDKAGNIKKEEYRDVAAGTVDTTTYDYSCW
ncbi:MAG: hypothetical protein RBU30_12650 [Polyangia bacterium]|jgi:hypothetical protein|nr:hypothetical protein [Polyangia bacterium]